MLCLNRNEGERILFYFDGEPLGWLSVVEIKGRQVRLGFDLPQRLRVVREEVQLHRRPAGEQKGDGYGRCDDA